MEPNEAVIMMFMVSPDRSVKTLPLTGLITLTIAGSKYGNIFLVSLPKAGLIGYIIMMNLVRAPDVEDCL